MRSVMLKHGLWKNLEIFPLSHGDTRVVAAGPAPTLHCRLTERVSTGYHPNCKGCLVLVAKIWNWMPSVASLNPAMLLAPLWCDLGCCSRTVVAIKAAVKTRNYLCADPRSYRIACSLFCITWKN